MQEIIEFILSSIVMVITPIIFGVLTLDNKIRKDKSKVVVAFFISMISAFLLFTFLDGQAKTIANFILHIFIFNQIFNLKLGKSIMVTFIYILILMVPDMLQLIFFTNILDFSKEYYYNIFAGGFLSNFLVCMNTCIITFFIRNSIKKVLTSKVENSNKLLTLSFFTLICIIILFFDIITNYKSDNNIWSYVLLITIFLIVITTLIKEKVEINDRIQEYNGLLGFMKSYESEIEENKIQNHEIKNQFLTIESMLNDEAPKQKIINYVKSVIKDNEDIDDTRYTDLQYLPLNGIKGFICSKLNKAEKENLDVSIIVEKGVENSVIGKLSTKDFKKLGILLGVYLDNAIEASASSEKRCLGLEIYLEKYGVIIIITNTFENVIKSNEENNKRISTKGIGRGYGLQLVNKVISGSKKFDVKSEVIEKAYVQKIMIKK